MRKRGLSVIIGLLLVAGLLAGCDSNVEESSGASSLPIASTPASSFVPTSEPASENDVMDENAVVTGLINLMSWPGINMVGFIHVPVSSTQELQQPVETVYGDYRDNVSFIASWILDEYNRTNGVEQKYYDNTEYSYYYPEELQAVTQDWLGYAYEFPESRIQEKNGSQIIPIASGLDTMYECEILPENVTIEGDLIDVQVTVENWYESLSYDLVYHFQYMPENTYCPYRLLSIESV